MLRTPPERLSGPVLIKVPAHLPTRLVVRPGSEGSPPFAEIDPGFATAYALFSGLVFLTTAALLLAPAFHRMIHHFHLEGDMEEEAEEEGEAPPSDHP